MQKATATILLCLPAICLAEYIRLPVDEAFAAADSTHGKLILSYQQKNCADGNWFALLIADKSLNYAGCWFYDETQDIVYVRFATERQHKSYPAGDFKMIREPGGVSFRGMANGLSLTPEQKKQALDARPGRWTAK